MKASPATLPPGAHLTSGLRLTACAAAWCGVHCALTPVLVLAAPVLALSEGVEVGAGIATIALGAVLLLLGPGRAHPTIVGTFVGGASLWAASAAGWLEPVPEPLTAAAGSLTLAGALFRSTRVCHVAECAACAEEDRGG